MGSIKQCITLWKYMQQNEGMLKSILEGGKASLECTFQCRSTLQQSSGLTGNMNCNFWYKSRRQFINTFVWNFSFLSRPIFSESWSSVFVSAEGWCWVAPDMRRKHNFQMLSKSVQKSLNVSRKYIDMKALGN